MIDQNSNNKYKSWKIINKICHAVIVILKYFLIVQLVIGNLNKYD